MLAAAALVVLTGAPVPGAAPAYAAQPRLKPGDGYDLQQLGHWTGCSMGPYLRGQDGIVFGLSAGHCGDDGLPVYLQDQHSTRVGTFTDPRYVAYCGVTVRDRSVSPPPVVCGGQYWEYDMARVVVDPVYVDPTVNGERVAGYLPVEKLWAAEQTGATVKVCKLGRSTGYTCGKFKTIWPRSGMIEADVYAQSGDSGGVVWSPGPDGALIVGTVMGGVCKDGRQSPSGEWTCDPRGGAGLNPVMTISPVEASMRAYDAVPVLGP